MNAGFLNDIGKFIVQTVVTNVEHAIIKCVNNGGYVVGSEFIRFVLFNAARCLIRSAIANNVGQSPSVIDSIVNPLKLTVKLFLLRAFLKRLDNDILSANKCYLANKV